MKSGLKNLKVIVLILLSIMHVTGQNVTMISINLETEAVIKSCINEINADSIRSYMQSLEDMETRYTYASNRKEVALWILSKFKSFGYTQAELQPFNHFNSNSYNSYSDQYNVTCILPGKTPFQIVVGAHHDAVQGSPGADDNASGTAGVLEMARVMKKLNLANNHSFKFITFAAEEVGLVGSNYSAQESIFLNDSISLMLNMDMISNSSSDSLNRVGINHHENDGELGELARFTGANYTGMITEYFGYPTNSDHHSYGKQGIPVIYFEEYVFSKFYHSKNDLVANTNAVYASRVLKTLAATAMAFDVLPTLPEPTIVQSGNGKNVKLQWEKKMMDDYYQVYIDSQNAGYQLISETNDPYVAINNLTPQKSYPVMIKVWDSNGNANGIELSVSSDSIPSIPKDVKTIGLSDMIQISWSKNPEEDMAGYNVYELINGSQVKKNKEVLPETNYSDYSISDTLFHYYKVSAIDEHGNESPKSIAQSSKLGKESYLEDSIELLVIIDVSAIPILGKETKDFFDQILFDKPHQTILLNSSTKLTNQILNYSKKVIWCGSAINAHSSAFEYNYNALINYLQNGGNLMLTVNDPNQFTSGFERTMPSLIPKNHPSNTYFKTDKVDFIPNSYCSGLRSLTSGYPNMAIDWSNVPETFISSNSLNFVQAIIPVLESTKIYSYQAPNPQDEHGRMHGLPIGIEYIGSDFNLVFLSIPVSFMKQEDALDFIDYVLNQKFDNQTNTATDSEQLQSREISIWPNPANTGFNFETSNAGNLTICNEYGIVVYTSHFLNATNTGYIDVTKWPKSLYLVTFQTVNTITTQKLIHF